MINFIKKFITSMSDEELDFLRGAIWEEGDVRARARRAEFGSELPELNDAEKALARVSKIDAIKAYRFRTGQYLAQSKNVVEDWLAKKE